MKIVEDWSNSSSEVYLPVFRPEDAFIIRTLDGFYQTTLGPQDFQNRIHDMFNRELERIKWLKLLICDEYLKAAQIAVDKKTLPYNLSGKLASCLSIPVNEIHNIGWARFANSCINVARNAAVTSDRITTEMSRITLFENQGLTIAFIRSRIQDLPDWAGPLH
jgi:hypothetical protein